MNEEKQYTPARPAIVSMSVEHADRLGECIGCLVTTGAERRTDHLLSVWINEEKFQKLVAMGVDPDRATRLLYREMEVRQRSAESWPYQLSYICREHLLKTMEIMTGSNELNNHHRLLYAKYNRHVRRHMWMFDRNQFANQTQPAIAVTNDETIPAFLARLGSSLDGVPAVLGEGEYVAHYDFSEDSEGK